MLQFMLSNVFLVATMTVFWSKTSGNNVSFRDIKIQVME